VSEVFHNYGAVIGAVVVAALISAAVAMSNRLDKIDDKILHKDYLEVRLDHIERRVQILENVNE